MKKIILIGILGFFAAGKTTAQVSPLIDSMVVQLSAIQTDTARVNILNRIASEIYFVNPDEIQAYASEALEMSEQIGYKKGIAQAYNNLGIYYRGKGIYDKAIDYFFHSLDIMEEINDEAGIARSYNLIGILYYYLNNYELSLEYYQKALAMNEAQNDKKWIAGNSNNIGMIYERLGEYDLALHHYLKAIEMSTELGNKNWLANHMGNLGSLYLKIGHPKSLDLFEQRLEIKEQLRDTTGMAQANYLIGSYYVQTANFQKALPYLVKGYEFAIQTNQLSVLSQCSELLSKTYANLNQYKLAYDYNKLFKKYNDSLDLQSNTEKIMRLTLQNDFREEQQAEELEAQNQKIRQTLIAFALVGGILIILSLFWRQRSKVKQHLLQESRLKIENEALIDDLSFKDRIMGDNINYLLNKNEILTDVIEKLTLLKEKLKPENQKLVNSIIFELQSGIHDNTWEEFEIRFNQIHSDFYEKLNKQFPDLSASESRLCAFLKLNMTSRDISAITGQSIKSIETARTRLRKKLDLVNKEISLNDFFGKM